MGTNRDGYQQIGLHLNSAQERGKKDIFQQSVGKYRRRFEQCVELGPAGMGSNSGRIGRMGMDLGSA